MKSTNFIGVTLIVLGIFTLIYQGFTTTNKAGVFDGDRIEGTTIIDENMSRSPLFGLLTLVAGIAVIIVGYGLDRKNKNVGEMQFREYPRTNYDEKIAKERL